MIVRSALSLILCLVLQPADAMAQQASDVVLERVRPDTLYAEQRGELTRLNFDFELANRSERDIDILYLEMRLFDSAGRFLARRYMGGNGLPGPIAMLPHRRIAPGESAYIFNPFPDLRLDAVPARLRVRIVHSGGSLEFERDLVEPEGPTLERSPIDALAYVYSGNDLFSHHRRVALNSEPAREIGIDRITQRFALDFTAIDPASGDLARGDGAALEDWHGFGLPVVAPAAGRVVAVRSGMPDNRFNANGQRIFADGFESFGEDRGLGNYVIIDLGGGFLLMSHFAQDSLSIGVGDDVETGELLGRVGLSGDTAYPHLHIQLQDSADFLGANPLPLRIDCWQSEQGAERSGSPDTGDVVLPCAAP